MIFLSSKQNNKTTKSSLEVDITHLLRNVNDLLDKVLYPWLRVEIPKIKIERVGGFPPRLIRPVGMESLDLEIDGHFSPLATAKGDGFGLLLHGLNDGFALVCLEFALGKGYTHDAVDSFWVDLWNTLLDHLEALQLSFSPIWPLARHVSFGQNCFEGSIGSSVLFFISTSCQGPSFFSSPSPNFTG
jgi:hypothetical protein